MGRGIQHPSRQALGLPIEWVLSLCPGGKDDGAWHLPRTPFGAEVKEGIEVYLYSPSVTSWSVQGLILPFKRYRSPSVYNKENEVFSISNNTYGKYAYHTGVFVIFTLRYKEHKISLWEI